MPPEFDQLLRDSWTRVARGAVEFGMTAPLAPPQLALANTGIVNSFAVIGSDRVLGIVFDSSVFVFCNMLSKVVVATMEQVVDGRPVLSTDPRYLEGRLRLPMLRERLCELFMSYLFDPHPALARPWLSSPFATGQAIKFTLAMEDFLMGHELAHLLLGHNSTSTSMAFPNSPADFTADIVTREIKQELEADQYGLLFAMMGSVESRSAQTQAFAVGLLFSALSTVGDLVHNLRFATFDPPVLGRDLQCFPDLGGSHPPTLLRVRGLKRGFESLKLPDVITSPVLAAFDQACFAWLEFTPVLFQMCRNASERNVWLHPRWGQTPPTHLLQ